MSHGHDSGSLPGAGWGTPPNPGRRHCHALLPLAWEKETRVALPGGAASATLDKATSAEWITGSGPVMTKSFR